MDVQSDYVESTTSALAFHNFSFNKNEDSGYHTSLTPGSLECSELPSDWELGWNYKDRISITGVHFDDLKVKYSWIDTPPVRRATKRPHPESANEKPFIPTPTTYIAGKIQTLEVNEDKENTTCNVKPHSAKSAKRYMCKINTYPITPVKRNCKLSPCRGSARKLDFAIHSLPCAKNELQPVNEHRTQTKLLKPILARPQQKIDIMHLLHESCAIPPLKKIFSYLTNQDIHSFCSVSARWNKIWNDNNNKQKKAELKKFVKIIKENQENDLRPVTPKVNMKPYDGCLREILNEIHNNQVNLVHNSPPCTPTTNRFRKFMKSASLDSRVQISCIRCSQPAKVTEEITGENWVECTNTTCSFQFCRNCNSPRHPGKVCFQYDLDAPSPSKRKKSEYVVGTRKSRKNLRRLL